MTGPTTTDPDHPSEAAGRNVPSAKTASGDTVATSSSADTTGLGFARLSRDSAVFALGSVAGKVIGVALLPVFTRMMTPEQYGRFDLLATLGSAGISILLLGMNVAAMRLALDPSRPEEERPHLLGSWLAIQVAVVLPPAVILLLAGPWISATIFGEGTPVQGIQLVSLILVAGTLQYLTLTVLRVQQRAAAYTTLIVGMLVLNAVLAIALLVGWASDERAPLLAYGVSLAAAAVFGLALIGRRWFARPRLSSVRTLLAMSLPLLPAIGAVQLAEFVNRGVLLGAASATELGYFSVALRFASVAALVVGGFHLAWQARAFALGTGPAALSQTAADAHRILVVVSGTVALIAIAGPELVLVVSGPAFAPSLPALGIALCGVLATAVYLVAAMPSALGNRFRDLGMSGALGVAVGVALNVVLAPRLGSSGTALAAALGQAVAAGLVWQMGRRHLALPLPLGRTAAVALPAIAIALLSTLPEAGGPLWFRSVLLIVFAIVIWRDGSLRPALRLLRMP